MPRDLSSFLSKATDDTLQSMPQLSSQKQESEPLHDDHDQDSDATEYLDELGQSNEKRDPLHPYTQTLSLSDIESCVRLEDAAFPPQERASREKFQYRLKHCGQLSLGIFTSDENSDATTASTALPAYSGAPERKSILLGHIVSTMTTNPTVTDNDMAIPSTEHPDAKLGHKPEGRTVCIHSLAVLPEYQGRSLGSTLMKAYLQRLKTQSVADHAALIAHDHLIPYYERFGFRNRGPSKAQFGGGGWYDMVVDLEALEEEE
ncbi:Putative GNAT domain, acyl-CoA N-acyltransferase [Septoria linicola]|uniref:GNAT domain, acyl-CoA N-acyltransferase n=1 Tax=Septoria linicola TaxID=215465 RepID=A0A9Q9ASR4_9PEZI|nr:putative GNAT domain, acyl-CoA N-acyltransferase [Septoria linicola]USW54440.1 Putative GNAT domain, acyl-CoA N-acyltransferase [Septoria linicola]